MDSHENATTPEERSITTVDASPSAVLQASTEPIAAEVHMGVNQLSTSRTQMEMSPLRDYIMDLSKEEWDSFSDAMTNPVTKAYFLEVCLIIAKHVNLSALQIIMPSLARRLGDDPEFLTASEESHGYVNAIGTGPKKTSIVNIEDDQDVIELSKGVLTKVIPEAGSRSCDEPLMSSPSSSGKRSSTSPQTISLPQHGITKEHMDDMTGNEPSPISPESIISIVNTISAELDVENEDFSLSLTSVEERLERLLCDETLSSLSHNLTNLIRHLYFKDQKGIAATKSASDSLLLSMGQSGKFLPKDTVRQVVQIYAEETVKHVLLPCFNIPSPWTIGMEGVFQHASSSASCPSFLHSLSEVEPQGASRSSSEILQRALQVLTTVMTRDFMKMLALQTLETLQTTGDLEGETDLSRSSSADPTEISGSKDIAIGSPYASPNSVDSTLEDYTSLVSILVIQLLSKLNDQESLSDDMLDISRVLINRLMTETDATLSIGKNMAPCDVRVKKVFRAIYNDLLHEFGSKDILLKAITSEDPCFEKSLVTSLTREFMQTTATPIPKEGECKKRTLRFLPKLSKIKAFFHIKKSKSDSNRKEQSNNVDQNLDPTSAHVDPAVLCAGCFSCAASVASSDKTTSASSEKKSHRGFFSRIISRLSRKSPKICPEALH